MERINMQMERHTGGKTHRQMDGIDKKIYRQMY
jgi:hypothetical protein